MGLEAFDVDPEEPADPPEPTDPPDPSDPEEELLTFVFLEVDLGLLAVNPEEPAEPEEPEEPEEP